jgi:hypothetical protein
MAGNFYLALDATTNLPKQVAATQTGSGSANAGQIVALNSSGYVDTTLLPPGLGQASLSVVASEALAAGAIVSFWSNAGVVNVRNANATDATKLPQGFVTAAVASSATATVYFSGQLNSSASGLTIGAPVYLSTTSGAVTTTAPSATGNLVAMLAPTAYSTTEFVFDVVSMVIHG